MPSLVGSEMCIRDSSNSTSSDSSGGQQPGPSPPVRPSRPVLKPATLPPPAIAESPNVSIPPQPPPGFIYTSTPLQPDRPPPPTAATGATPKRPQGRGRGSSPDQHLPTRQRPPLPVTFQTRHPGVADKIPIGKRKRPPRATPNTTFQEPPHSKPRQPKRALPPTGPPPLTRAAAAAGNIVLPKPPYLGSTIERMLQKQLKKKFKNKDSDSSSSDTQ